MSVQQHSADQANSGSRAQQIFVPGTTQQGLTVEDCKTEDDAHDEGQANLLRQLGTKICDDCIKAIRPLSVHSDPMSWLSQAVAPWTFYR